MYATLDDIRGNVWGEGHPLDWEVHHNGYLWRNTSSGNHWEPGVWGWTQVEPL